MNLKILNIEDGCTGCGACANICPKHCLTIKPNAEGFYYPVYDPTDCIGCGLCEKTCHIITPQPESYKQPVFYLYHTTDESLRQGSTSGGAFSLMADYVLSQRGIVYGCTYDGEKECLIVKDTDQTSLASLRKSKYVESFTDSSFSRIKDSLKNKRLTLFCGTPCQVSGLLSFLKQSHMETTNLITIDFACHGVPSNGCFTEFKHYFEKGKRKVINADFRYKNYARNIGWHDMVLALGLSNGNKKTIKYNTYYYYYYYYQPFIDDIMLRKCCYKCNRILDSKADFSIGDFWGINEYRPSIDDNKGFSYIKINNTDFIDLFKRLTSGNCYAEQLPEQAMQYQYHVRNKDKKRIVRDAFFEDVQELGYINAVNKYYGRYRIIKSILVGKSKEIVKKIIGRK